MFLFVKCVLCIIKKKKLSYKKKTAVSVIAIGLFNDPSRMYWLTVVFALA